MSKGTIMNKAIEAAAMSRTILDQDLISHMTTARLEELLNTIAVELRERDIKVQYLDEIFTAYEKELMSYDVFSYVV
jgi:argininosuccinate lyase